MAGENKIKPKGFKKWVEHFWYYYKIHTIFLLVALITLAVCITQCSGRTNYDYQFILATSSVEMLPVQVKAMEKELLKYCTDQNGDGEVNIQLVDCTFSKTGSTRARVDSKKREIQSIVTGEQEVLLYFMDKECFEWLDGAIDGGFFEERGLSEENGKYLPLTESEILTLPKAGLTSAEYRWPKELLVSKRIVKGTLIENKKGILESNKKADEILEKIKTANS